MSKADVIKFYEATADDTELKEKLKGPFPDEATAIDTFIKVAAERNLHFTKEEFEQWVATDRNGRFPIRVEAHGDSRPQLNEQGEQQELSDEQLEAVAGGKGGLLGAVGRALIGDVGTGDRD
jgi:hypothetical protein